MLYNATNGTIQIGNTEMDYIRFGTGERILVMLPGLGDGLRSVKGTALPMAFAYRAFAKKFTVYGFSRKNALPQGYTTREMALDQAQAMELLDIPKADVLGVSMGGMIAQYLAIDYPEKVGKLILTVTSARPNPILSSSIGEWVSCAKRGDQTAFMDSNVRRFYSEEYYRKNKWLVPIMGRLTKPKSYDRFFIQADACLKHDAFESLHQIQAPTLVIGGEKDNALGGDASREIAAQIPGAELRMTNSGVTACTRKPRILTRVFCTFWTRSDKETEMTNEKVFAMSFAKVYPMLIAKAERKGRTRDEVLIVTEWLTGYTGEQLEELLDSDVTYGDFFRKAPALNPARKRITGSVCGVKVETIEDPLMREIRILDKLVDELAKGKPMEKIMR